MGGSSTNSFVSKGCGFTAGTPVATTLAASVVGGVGGAMTVAGVGVATAVGREGFILIVERA